MTAADDKRLQDQENAANNAGAGVCRHGVGIALWCPACDLYDQPATAPAPLPQADDTSPETRSEVEREYPDVLHPDRPARVDWWWTEEGRAQHDAQVAAKALRDADLHRLHERLMTCTEHRDVRRYGEEGTAFSNGAKRMAVAVRAEFGAAFAALRDRADRIEGGNQ